MDVLRKTWKELEYVIYPLEVKNKVRRKWSEIIKKKISNKKKARVQSLMVYMFLNMSYMMTLIEL